VALIRRGTKRTCTSEDTIELIGRLAAHHPDQQIAAVLNRQGRQTGTGLPFTATRVQGIRQRAGIPVAPPPDPDGETVTVEQAAATLQVSTATIHRWLREGLLPGEQVTAGAPWRIRLTDEIRSRFVPDIPDGYLPLNEAAKRLGVARQTVLHQVQRGQRDAVHVTTGRRKGLRIQVLQGTIGARYPPEGLLGARRAWSASRGGRPIASRFGADSRATARIDTPPLPRRAAVQQSG
jgi:excisionase family DNA binding protein